MSAAAKAQRLATKAVSAFETAHGDLMEAARLQAQEAQDARATASAAQARALALDAEAATNVRRAQALGQILNP